MKLAHRIFFVQAEDGIRDATVTGVQTCALPISGSWRSLDPDGVAGAFDGQTQDVKTWPQVGDGARRERAHGSHAGARGTARSPAPDPAASSATSLKIPPAVTASPAPGPWITSGLAR